MDCSVCMDPSQHYQVDFYLRMTVAVLKCYEDSKTKKRLSEGKVKLRIQMAAFQGAAFS